jgi:hypothetical protein
MSHFLHLLPLKLISSSLFELNSGGERFGKLTHGMVGCRLSTSDMADRPPRVLSSGEVIGIGGKRFRYIDAPHVPHGWDAGVMFEETTGTLLCGNLFTQVGNGPPITDGDIVGPSIWDGRLIPIHQPWTDARSNDSQARRP